MSEERAAPRQNESRAGAARDAGPAPASDSSDSSDAGAARGATPGPRRIAEWVSFGISLAIILALVVHLSWRLLASPAVLPNVRVTPRFEGVAEVGGHFVLPLEVSNPGPRTIQDVQIRIRYRSRRGATESMDLVIDYVGLTSTQTVFAHFDRDPRGMAVEADAISSRLE